MCSTALVCMYQVAPDLVAGAAHLHFPPAKGKHGGLCARRHVDLYMSPPLTTSPALKPTHALEAAL